MTDLTRTLNETEEWLENEAAETDYRYKAIFFANIILAQLPRPTPIEADVVEVVENTIAKMVRPEYLAGYSYRDVAKAAITAMQGLTSSGALSKKEGKRLFDAGWDEAVKHMNANPQPSKSADQPVFSAF